MTPPLPSPHGYAAQFAAANARAHAALSHVPLPHHPSAGTPALVREAAEDPQPGTAEWVSLRVLEQLTHLSDNLRQTLTDKLWQTIPSFVEEFGRSDAWAAGSPVAWACEFYELVRIERVVVSIPAGCTGTLTLGGHVFPNLAAGVTVLELGKLLDGQSARRLELASGVPAAGSVATVALYGHQLPTTGSMAP